MGLFQLFGPTYLNQVHMQKIGSFSMAFHGSLEEHLYVYVSVCVCMCMCLYVSVSLSIDDETP